MQVALDLIDEAGFDSLTIRAVAQRAGIAAMSLYTHFENKQDLLEAVYAEIARQLGHDSDAATWQEEMHASSQRIHALMLRHPQWRRALERPDIVQALLSRERLLALMAAGGYSVEEAYAALLCSVLLAVGFALIDVTRKNAEGEAVADQSYEAFKRLTEASEFADAHPLTHQAVANAPRLELSRRLDDAVRLAIRGLEAERGGDGLTVASG